MQTFHLRAQRRFFVKVTMDEIAILLRCDSTHPVNPDTTRMADHFAHHVLCHLIFVPADRRVAVAPLIPIFTVNIFSQLNCEFDWNYRTRTQVQFWSYLMRFLSNLENLDTHSYFTRIVLQSSWINILRIFQVICFDILLYYFHLEKYIETRITWSVG